MKKLLAMILAVSLLCPVFSVSAAGDTLTFASDFIEGYRVAFFSLGTNETDFNNRPLYIEGLGTAVAKKDQKDNNLGVLNDKGEFVIPAKYENLGGLVSDKYLIAQRTDEAQHSYASLLDFQGNAIIPEGKYAYLATVFNSDLMMASDGKKIGVITIEEKVKVPFEYDAISCLSKEEFCVQKDGKYGVVDVNGKVIVPFEYSSIIFKYLDTVYRVMISGHIAILGPDGKIRHDDVNYASENKAKGYYSIRKGSETTLYNPDGTPYVEKKSETEQKLNSMGYALTNDWGDCYSVEPLGQQNTGKVGLVDKHFQVVIPLEYSYVMQISDTEYFRAQLAGNGNESNFKFFDKTGTEVPFDYKVNPYVKGFFRAPVNGATNYNMSESFDVVNSEGSILIPGIYKPRIYPCRENLYIMEYVDGKMVYLEKNGTGRPVTDYVPGIRLKLNSTEYQKGLEVYTNDVAPIIRNDRTMLPARLVAESLGCSVEWNEETQEVVIKNKGGYEQLRLTVGSTEAMLSQIRRIKSDVAPFVENGRTYVPVRFLVENIGGAVSWNAENETIEII